MIPKKSIIFFCDYCGHTRPFTGKENGKECSLKMAYPKCKHCGRWMVMERDENGKK